MQPSPPQCLHLRDGCSTITLPFPLQ